MYFFSSGQTATLKAEIDNQISAGKAWKLILPGGSIGAVAEQTGIQVEVNSNFSKVSLISMLAPSPDWYVGIDSHDLCDNGKWRETWNVTMLPPYDSGTDSGLQFTSANQVTNPPVDIFRITHTMDGAFNAPNPIQSLGEFRFIGTDLPISPMMNSSERSATPTYKMTASVSPTTKYPQTAQQSTTAQPTTTAQATTTTAQPITTAQPTTTVKCPGTAKYTLTFRVTWTTANHPNTALPNSAHFSPLIGCSHNSDYIMWRRGLKASPGVKVVAEIG